MVEIRPVNYIIEPLQVANKDRIDKNRIGTISHPWGSLVDLSLLLWLLAALPSVGMLRFISGGEKLVGITVVVTFTSTLGNTVVQVCL